MKKIFLAISLFSILPTLTSEAPDCKVFVRYMLEMAAGTNCRQDKELRIANIKELHTPNLQEILTQAQQEQLTAAQVELNLAPHECAPCRQIGEGLWERATDKRMVFRTFERLMHKMNVTHHEYHSTLDPHRVSYEQFVEDSNTLSIGDGYSSGHDSTRPFDY